MSLDPERRQVVQSAKKLAPPPPGEREQVKVDELKQHNEQGVVGFLRKIFAK